MPAMNGRILAADLNARYTELKAALHSGALDIDEGEMMSVDGLFSTRDGVGALLSKITGFEQTDPPSPTPELCDHCGSGSADSK
jgi:hypothetical protein